jgi:hypothetical protein
MGGMLSQITRRTVALGVQLGGVITLAAVSMLGLHRDSTVLTLGAYAFVVGCLLEAQSVSQRGEAAKPADTAKTGLSDFRDSIRQRSFPAL